MWEAGRKAVAEVFFKDRIELYENTIVKNDIGEEHVSPVLVDTYNCNIQNGESSTKEGEVGVSIPQSLRISLAKTVPLDYNKTYQLKIKTARISFNENEMWKVEGWVEGQLSTVITAQREVSI